MGQSGVEEGGGQRFFIRDFWEIKNSHLECGWEEWRRSMYFVYDFNGRRLKDSSFIYWFDVLLSVEGSVVLVIKVGCFLRLVSIHFFKTKSKAARLLGSF
jgi:hypothetical protein